MAIELRNCQGLVRAFKLIGDAHEIRALPPRKPITFTGCITTDPTGADCTWIQFENKGDSRVEFMPSGGEVPYSVPTGDGPKVIYAFAKDAAGNIESEGGTVELVTAPITGSLLIDGGAAMTYEPFINVMVVPPLADGLECMRVAFVPNKTFSSFPKSTILYSYDNIPEDGYFVALPKDTPAGTKITIYAW